MAKSKVFFIPINDSANLEELKTGFDKIIIESGLLSKIKEEEFAAVKLHFGEEGCEGFINPAVVKILIDKIHKKKAKPFLTDTNVLYKGMRSNAVDHLTIAHKHGFSYESTGAPIIISDGIFGENEKSFKVNGATIKSVKAAAPINYFDHLLSLAHCTGHMNTSYAGALKNVCMGLASRAGKQIQHTSTKPTINADKCILCKRCLSFCPENAIIEKNGKSYIIKEKCVGCSECIIACKQFAVNISWVEDILLAQEKMAEYAMGILSQIKNSVFFNFAIHITNDCDCMGKSDVIADNIGILASEDPVAIDRASYDLILEKMGKDIFKDKYPDSDCNRMIEYAEQLKLGTMDYEIIKLN